MTDKQNDIENLQYAMKKLADALDTPDHVRASLEALARHSQGPVSDDDRIRLAVDACMKEYVWTAPLEAVEILHSFRHTLDKMFPMTEHSTTH